MHSALYLPKPSAQLLPPYLNPDQNLGLGWMPVVYGGRFQIFVVFQVTSFVWDGFKPNLQPTGGSALIKQYQRIKMGFSQH